MRNYESNPQNPFTRGDINNAIALFEEYIEKIKNNIDAKNIQQYSHLFRKKLVSCLTDSLIRSISYDETSRELVLDNNHAILCKLLAKTIFTCITRNPEVAIYEKKGEIVIRTLFNLYVDSKVNQGYMLLPPDYRPNSTDPGIVIARCCLDYIAGMMDTYAIAEYERLTGIPFDNINILKIPAILDIRESNLT